MTMFNVAVEARYKYGFGRVALILESFDRSLKFRVPEMTGNFNHLLWEPLKIVNWGELREEALWNCGRLLPIQTVALNEDEIRHLMLNRVSRG